MNAMAKRRTEITIETQSLTIIRMHGAKTDFVYCRNCQTEVGGFPPPHASLIFSVAGRELSRLCQNGQIHFALPSVLCGNSLADYFKQEIRFIED
jgi:hypothetical protein